jgi:hypothetical protein
MLQDVPRFRALVPTAIFTPAACGCNEWKLVKHILHDTWFSVVQDTLLWIASFIRLFVGPFAHVHYVYTVVVVTNGDAVKMVLT